MGLQQTAQEVADELLAVAMAGMETAMRRFVTMCRCLELAETVGRMGLDSEAVAEVEQEILFRLMKTHI